MIVLFVYMIVCTIYATIDVLVNLAEVIIKKYRRL